MYDPNELESIEEKYDETLKEKVRTIASVKPLFLSDNEHIQLIAGTLGFLIALAGFSIYVFMRATR
jgi:hypothetical protein